MIRKIGIGIALMILLLSRGIYAMEDEENHTIESVISFELTANDRFTYEIKVGEGGSLIDGKQSITKGIMAYELRVGEEKQFFIKADSGYEVKEILMNARPLSTQLNCITIVGISKNSQLEVRFKKVKENAASTEETEVEKKQQIKKENSLLPTGDMLKVGEYLCKLLIIASILYVNKKDIDTYKSVDNIAIRNNKNMEDRKDE